MNRFDIAIGAKPPEPEKIDIGPLVKYHANKNIKLLMVEFRMDSNGLDKYVSYLGKTLNKVQIAHLFADYRRLTASCKNYFKNERLGLYHLNEYPKYDDHFQYRSR